MLSKPASFDRLSDDMGRDGLSPGMGVLGRALGPWPLRGVFTFALKTAAPLSALEFFDAATLKAKRVECLLKEVAPTCPRPRFARRGQASRIYPLRSKRFAVSDVFPLWRARALAASRPSALPRALSVKMRRDVRPRLTRPVRLTARGRFESREAASNRARNLFHFARKTRSLS